MVINIKLIGVVTLIYVTTVYAQCNKSIVGCANTSYTFQLDCRVIPDRDTVSIGDTIWVEINSPNTFIDLQSNQPINFSNANNLGTNMGFVKLINRSPIQLADAVDSFKFVLITGSEITSPIPHLEKDFLINDVNGMYVFKLGVIPKNSGTYRFNLGNPAGVYRNSNSCPKANFNMRLTQTNQHYYLYPGGAGVTPAGADYYFHVR